MKRSAALLIVLLQLFNAPASWANDTFYLGASYGMTTYDTGYTNPTGTSKLDDETTSSKVLVGMEVGFGLIGEVYYADLGGVTYTGNAGDTITDKMGSVITIPVNGYSSESQNSGYGVNAIYKIGFGIASVYAKAGLMHWSEEVTTSAPVYTTRITNDSGNELLVGAGVEFSVAPFIAVRVDYEQTEVADDDISTIAAGIVVGF